MLIGRQSIRAKLAILALASVLGILITLAVAYHAVNQVKIGSAMYGQIVDGKDLLADILPPPEYLIESYLTALQLSEPARSRNVPVLLERYAQLRKDYDDRHNFWLGQLRDQPMRQTLLEGSYKPAMQFFQIMDQQLIPAVKAGEYAKAQKISDGELQVCYEQHRQSIDRLVEQANAYTARVEGQSQAALRSNTNLVLLCVGGIAGVAMLASFLAYRCMHESEARFRSMSTAAQDGVIMMDHMGRISFWNKAAAGMFGYSEAEALGQSLHALLTPNRYYAAHDAAFPNFRTTGQGPAVGKLVELVGRRRDGGEFPVELSLAPVRIADQWHAVAILRDITERKRAEAQLTAALAKQEQLLAEQQLNIEIAGQLLHLVNHRYVRHVDLDDRRELFVEDVSATTKAAGADHYFATVVPGRDGKPAHTVVSLKDQSGHEVNCILRSIATDLVHHEVLSRSADLSLEQQLAGVNDRLCDSGMFKPGDFVTSVNLEIDHSTRLMRYACCGHPPLLVIRGTAVHLLPEAGEPGQGLPMGAIREIRYVCGEWKLEDGDRVLLYTDGLVEMPLRNCSRRIDSQELKGMVQRLVAETPDLPISIIIRLLMESLMKLCKEGIIPGGQTTAEDDVTIVGLEVKRNARATEVVLRPRDSDELSDAIERIHDAIRSELAAGGFEAADIDLDSRLRLILEEMILNAWQHGNRQTPELPITVRWRHRNDLVLEVIDQGEGFDPSTIPDPRYGERRLGFSGRGLLIVRRSCDTVRWKSGGRHIVASIMRKLHPRDARRGAPH